MPLDRLKNALPLENRYEADVPKNVPELSMRENSAHWNVFEGCLADTMERYFSEEKLDRTAALALFRKQVCRLKELAEEYGVAKGAFMSANPTLKNFGNTSIREHLGFDGNSSERTSEYCQTTVGTNETAKAFIQKIDALERILSYEISQGERTTEELFAAIGTYPDLAAFLPDECLGNQDFVNRLVKSRPEAFRHLPEAFRTKENAPEEARSSDIRYADARSLRENPEKIRALITKIADLSPKACFEELCKIEPGSGLRESSAFVEPLESALSSHSEKYPIFRRLKGERWYRGRNFAHLLSAVSIEAAGLSDAFWSMRSDFERGNVRRMRETYDESFLRFESSTWGDVLTDLLDLMGISKVLWKENRDVVERSLANSTETSVLRIFGTELSKRQLHERSALNLIPKRDLESMLAFVGLGAVSWENSEAYSDAFDRLEIADPHKRWFAMTIAAMLGTASDSRAKTFETIAGRYSAKEEIGRIRKTRHDIVIGSESAWRRESVYSVIAEAFSDPSYGTEGRERILKKNREFGELLSDAVDENGNFRISGTELKRRLKGIFEGTSVWKALEGAKGAKEAYRILAKAAEDRRDAARTATEWFVDPENLAKKPPEEKGKISDYLSNPSVDSERKLEELKRDGILKGDIPENPEEREQMLSGVQELLRAENVRNQMVQNASDGTKMAAFEAYFAGHLSSGELRIEIARRDEEIRNGIPEKRDSDARPDLKKSDGDFGIAGNPREFLAKTEPGKTYRISEGYEAFRTSSGIEFRTPDGSVRFDGKSAEAAIAVASTLHSVGADFLIPAIETIARASDVVIRDGTLSAVEEANVLLRISDFLGIDGFDREESDVQALRRSFALACSVRDGGIAAMARKRNVLTETGSLSWKWLAQALERAGVSRITEIPGRG